MDRNKRLASNTLILSIGTFSSKLLVYFLMPLYTALLTTEQYGTADLITNAANLLIPFCCIGITHAVFRFSADKGEDNKEIFSTGISVFIRSAIVFLLFSPLLFLVSYINEYVWLLIVYVLCANVHSICAEYVRAREKTSLFALQGIIGTALTIAFNLLFLIVLDMGVVGYVLSVAVADAITTVFLIIREKLWRDFSFKRVSSSKMREMLRYSIPMMPTTVIWWITNVSDRYIVTFMKGAAENGIYSAAYKIPTLITLISTVFIEAWQLSVISDSHGKEDTESFFSDIFYRYQSIVFMCCSLLIPLSQIGTAILLNEPYYDAWRFIPTLLVATVFSSLTSFMGTPYTVAKKTTMSMVTALFGALLNIVMNILLIPSMGAQGAAIATALSYFAVFVLRAINSRRYIAFNMHPTKLFLNTGIVLLQSIFMIMELPYNLWVQLGSVALLFVLNGRTVFGAMLGILKKILKK